MPVSETPRGQPIPHLREQLQLAENAAQYGIKALPGKKWAVHYPEKGAVREEKLDGLLTGKYEPAAVADALRPDGIIYNVSEIGTLGIEAVYARIQQMSLHIANYDYRKLAEFIAGLNGKEIDRETAQALYDEIAEARIDKVMIDAFSRTGQEQMRQALTQEAAQKIAGIDQQTGIEKVMQTLKVAWISEGAGTVDRAALEGMIDKLNPEEKKLFTELRNDYIQYVNQGTERDYIKIAEKIKETLGEKQPQKTKGEELEEELKEFTDQNGQPGLPGQPNDPAIPPDDEDEYNTPPPPLPGESRENAPGTTQPPLFEITPPLKADYCAGKKSYFNIDQKTWSKKKVLTPYAKNVPGTKRYTITGTIEGNVKALPIPNHYAIDLASLKVSAGDPPQFFRDQNGCFYVQSTTRCTFSIDFLKEQPPFIKNPIPEDTGALYRGTLSGKTEQAITQLHGTNIEKAEQARAYVRKNHFYPGAGDLQMAQALQHKLRTTSTGDNYLQNLDQSEYLECYSANTLFIAMVRKAGVPARLVVGHHVDRATKGKALITMKTGHAWTEIWDGTDWVRVDATPPPKPEDKKKKEQKKKDEGTPPEEDDDTTTDCDEAEDNGMEPPDDEPEDDDEGEGEEGESGDVVDKTRKKSKKRQKKVQEPDEAEGNDMDQAQKDLEKAQKKREEMQRKKEQMKQKAEDADSFKDLKDLYKEAEEEELFNEDKQELKDQLDAKKQEMKEEIQNELQQMFDDGFLDEARKEELERELAKDNLDNLDRLKQQIDQEMRLYRDYEAIKAEIMPLVDQWFRFFAEKLPKEKSAEIDEDSRTRTGAFDRRAMTNARSILFGLVRNPRVFKSSVKPRFIASYLVDVSGSMAGQKLLNARKALIFYSELFSRISQVFGYIRFSIHTFADSIEKIKGFDQDYASTNRYPFPDGEQSTVKLRLMKHVKTSGSTNMLDAIRLAAAELNEQKKGYPDHASALYFTGDGDDSYGNGPKIRQFLQYEDTEHGFGGHMYSATLLGGTKDRALLANIFGEEHTNVAGNFEELIEQSMMQFDRDISLYLQGKTV